MTIVLDLDFLTRDEFGKGLYTIGFVARFVFILVMLAIHGDAARWTSKIKVLLQQGVSAR